MCLVYLGETCLQGQGFYHSDCFRLEVVDEGQMKNGECIPLVDACRSVAEKICKGTSEVSRGNEC